MNEQKSLMPESLTYTVSWFSCPDQSDPTAGGDLYGITAKNHAGKTVAEWVHGDPRELFAKMLRDRARKAKGQDRLETYTGEVAQWREAQETMLPQGWWY